MQTSVEVHLHTAPHTLTAWDTVTHTGKNRHLDTAYTPTVTDPKRFQSKAEGNRDPFITTTPPTHTQQTLEIMARSLRIDTADGAGIRPSEA